MTAYYLMLSGICLCGACLCVRNRSRLKDSVFLLISFVVLCVMSAVRYDVGVDYSYIYSPGFQKILTDPSGAYLSAHRWEPGFKWMIRAIFSVTQNYHAPFVVISIIIISLVILYYWLYSPNPFISVFLFIALSQYYCSMNFMRQMIAAAIAMYAFPLLKKRNALSIAGYFALVLLAASFHKSALILIPFFFINLIPINKYTLAAYVAITTAIFFNTHRIVEFVTRYWYSSYGINNVHMKAAFTPQFAIAVAVLFVIVFIESDKLKELDKQNYLYVNYAFFTMFFVIMGMRHSILDRLSMYFELLGPVAIAIIVNGLSKKLKEEKPSALINRYSAVLACVLITIFGGGIAIHQYALVRDHNGVVPYKVIFNQPFYRGYVDSLKDRPIIEEPIMQPDDYIATEDFPTPQTQNPTPQGEESDMSGALDKQEARDGEPGKVSLDDFLNNW